MFQLVEVSMPIGFFNSLRVSHKLLVISLSFSLPIAVLLYFMVTGINSDIQFNRLETMGDAYQRPLERLLNHIGETRLLALRMKAGEKDLDSRLRAAVTEVDAAFTELEDTDGRIGTDLEFTESGLKKRGREHFRVQTVKKEWDDVKSRVAAGEPHDQLLHLLQDIRTMITHAGDTSNLILDPDLDSYYLMDITLLRLPQTQDRLATILAYGIESLSSQQLSQEARVQLAVYASILQESDFDLVIADSVTVLTEDDNFPKDLPADERRSESLQRNLPRAIDAYKTATEPFIKMLRAMSTAEESTVSPADFVSAGTHAREASFTLWDTAVAELDVLLGVRIAMYQKKRSLALALTVIALALALALVYVVGRSITTRVSRCVVGMQALAAKDLTHQLGIDGGGELGEMAVAVDRAVFGMREAIDAMGQNATVLAGASEQQTAASHQMSANAEETSVQANVVSAAAEQVSKSVQTVASATEEMTASIKEVARQAHESTKVATEAVKMAEATNATVSKLGTSSVDIGNVVKVITSIAEQTNLLALNATIEAARAGEVGKGFAVVANEVKELAKETAKATEEISQKIGTIQSDTQAAVAAITQIGTIINHINEIQSSIATSVEEQTVTTREIGRNVHEAARGTTEIARNILGVAEAAKNTSAGAHQTEQAARELARMAAELKELVGHFKCR
jgi:methyl-accepting chemotaxis protein